LGSNRPIEPSPKVHYWPEGPPENSRRWYSLWCGSVVGRRDYMGGPSLPVSYYWTKNLTKVTCDRCRNKYNRAELMKLRPKKVMGIVEIK